MLPMTVSEIAQAVGGELTGTPISGETAITNVVIDSRDIPANALFVPILGDRFDGHDFIPTARKNGAVCVLSSRPLNDGPYILVDDTLAALQAIASHYRDKFTIPVIGITGSVGKTSTKEMLYSVLSTQLCTLKTLGSFNNQTGVPLTLFRLEPTHQVAIIEMGTNHFGEIETLSKIVKPTVCLFTNIGVAHIEFFGSREGILQGKTEMLHGMQPGGHVIVNGDDDLLVTIPDALCYGFSETCDVRATDIRDLGLRGSLFSVTYQNRRVRVRVPAPGLHSIRNALAAIATGLTLGLSLEALAAGVESYTPPTGRMDIRFTDRMTVIDDTYNANPTSVEASIDAMSGATGRRVCILGDMLELGEQSPAYHAEVGRYAIEHQIDLLLCVGPESRHTYEAAIALSPKSALYFETQQAMLEQLDDLLCSGDTVLVKASRGMHLENTVKQLLSSSQTGKTEN